MDSVFEKRNFDNCDTILLLMFNFLTVLGGGGWGVVWVHDICSRRKTIVIIWYIY